MKQRIRSLLSLAVISCGFCHAGEGKHLFILSGQSNMAGLKPEQSFVPVVEKAFGKDKVIVVKDAQSGRPIRDWYRNWHPAGGKVADGKSAHGKLYDRLMGRVKPAIQGVQLASVTFVWMQGERDAREKHGEVYAESFKGLLAQLQADLKRDDIHFVIGRLSDFDMANKKYPHWTMVREAQVRLAEADSKGAWVDTDAWNGNNNDLHYDQAGYRKLGEAFADKAIALIRGR